VGWAIVQLPADYFQPKKRPPLSTWEEHPVLATNLPDREESARTRVDHRRDRHARTWPGQALLTIVVGVVLMNFPGKYRPRTLVGNASPRCGVRSTGYDGEPVGRGCSDRNSTGAKLKNIELS